MPSDNTDEQVVSITIPVDIQPEEPTLAPVQQVDAEDSTSSVVQEQPLADLTKHPGGRPCKYCENKESILKKTFEYFERCKIPSKPQIPYIEELAMELDEIGENINNWAHKKTQTGELEHEEFFTAIKKIKEFQKLRLLQRTNGRYNPSGAIFQLKANHGLIESEKKIIAGSNQEPIQIEIIREEVKLHE